MVLGKVLLVAAGFQAAYITARFIYGIDWPHDLEWPLWAELLVFGALMFAGSRRIGWQR